MEINLTYPDCLEKGMKINKFLQLECSVDEFDNIKLRSDKINCVYSCVPLIIIMRLTILFVLIIQYTIRSSVRQISITEVYCV